MKRVLRWLAGLAEDLVPLLILVLLLFGAVVGIGFLVELPW